MATSLLSIQTHWQPFELDLFLQIISIIAFLIFDACQLRSGENNWDLVTRTLRCESNLDLLSVALTLSFQHTDVTESPSTDRSHSLVTCRRDHRGEKRPNPSGTQRNPSEPSPCLAEQLTWLVQALHR